MPEDNKALSRAPQEKPEITKEDGVVEKIAKDLKVNLPTGNLPLLTKLVALFTLVGGLSIGGSAFADIFNPLRVNFGLYLLRLAAGFIFIFIAYGIIKQQRWSIWLYGFLVLASFFVNPVFSLLPALIVVYLYFQRYYFYPSVFDRMVRLFLDSINESIKELRGFRKED